MLNKKLKQKINRALQRYRTDKENSVPIVMRPGAKHEPPSHKANS